MNYCDQNCNKYNIKKQWLNNLNNLMQNMVYLYQKIDFDLYNLCRCP
jgi:hypothetical protein